MKKKHNLQKRITRLNNILLKNIAAVYVLKPNKSYAHVVNLKTQKEIIVSPELDSALRKIKHDWSILLTIFCKTDTYYYPKFDVLRVQSPCYQHDLADIATQKHKELLDTANDNHAIGLGWIAVPKPYNFTEDTDDHYIDLFEKYNCWEPVDNKLEHLKETK